MLQGGLLWRGGGEVRTAEGGGKSVGKVDGMLREEEKEEEDVVV